MYFPQGPLPAPRPGEDCRSGDPQCKEECITVPEEKCETKYSQECRTITDNKCETVYENKAGI